MVKSKNKIQPIKQVPLKKDKAIYEVVKLFGEYQDTVSAIMDDYIVGNDGMFLELTAADKKFISAVSALEIEPDEADDDTEDIVVDNDIRIQVDNMNMRNKLEDFLKTEIYPDYNDQQSYLIGL